MNSFSLQMISHESSSTFSYYLCSKAYRIQLVKLVLNLMTGLDRFYLTFIFGCLQGDTCERCDSFLITIRIDSYKQTVIIMAQEYLSDRRLTRLIKNTAILGEPDIISIRQIKSSTGFFSRDKKIEDLRQNFINGLIFPTTAHFSSFISSRYNTKESNKLTVKAKLFMFDAFEEKDIHVEICIPGSLEIRVINLAGENVPFKTEDYERAYFSSFLRSLRPMNFPQIILYPLINRVEILKPIIKNFVGFSFRNSLRQLQFQLQGYKSERGVRNIGLDLLISYCLDNSFYFLIEIILIEVKKVNIPKYQQIDYLVKVKKRKYGEVIQKTAEKLLMHQNARQLKQLQIKVLFSLEKYNEVTQIGRTLIESGGTTTSISKSILQSFILIKEDRKFLKVLNIVHYFIGNQVNLQKASYLDQNDMKINLEKNIGAMSTISEHPQLCFCFDNTFYNKLAEYHSMMDLLKVHSKQGTTLKMLEKIEECLKSDSIFLDVLVYFEKARGWKNVIRTRGQCFWLESDFKTYQQSIKNSDFDDNRSFFQNSFTEQQEHEPNSQEVTSIERDLEKCEKEPEQKNVKPEQFEEEFDGNLSEIDESEQYIMPPASTRLIGLRQGQPRKQGKVLCGQSLQLLFYNLLQNLKLQSSLESWQGKMQGSQPFSYPVGKKEIAAMIFLKKGFLHKKLMRYKKSEESFKKSRKLSTSYGLSLVATYQLLLLYLQKKNVKGLQFYLIELIALLKGLGIESFDIVPQWCKPIIQFILQNQGLSIIRNLHPLFKSVIGNFLRCNYTQAEIQPFLSSTKQKQQA